MLGCYYMTINNKKSSQWWRAALHVLPVLGTFHHSPSRSTQKKWSYMHTTAAVMRRPQKILSYDNAEVELLFIVMLTNSQTNTLSEGISDWRSIGGNQYVKLNSINFQDTGHLVSSPAHFRPPFLMGPKNGGRKWAGDETTGHLGRNVWLPTQFSKVLVLN